MNTTFLIKNEKIKAEIKKEIQSIFDEKNLFEDLLDFYRSIFEENYKYIIIIPRKCLTEYKCLKLFDEEIAGLSNDPSFLTQITTPHGIVNYIDAIKKDIKEGKVDEKYIALIDDIMIYGRGIKDFLDQFLNYFKEDEKEILRSYIQLETFIESDKVFLQDYYKDIYNKGETYYSNKKLPFVKSVSDLFINSFLVEPMPNTSFISSWKIVEGNKSSKIWKDESIFSELINKNKEPKSWKKYGYSVSIICDLEKKFFRKVADFCCIRKYFNKYTGINVYTPYIFLKQMDSATIDEILEDLKENLLDEEIVQNVHWYTSNDEKSKRDSYILKYEYLTYILSNLYGIYVWKKNSADEELKWEDFFESDQDIIGFSYGKENVINLSALSQSEKLNEYIEKFSSRFTGRIIPDYGEFLEEKQAVDLFQDAAIELNDINSILESYLQKNNLDDERKAGTKDKRIFGITLQGLYKLIKQKIDISIEKYYKNVIYYMDAGYVALKVKCLREEGEEYIIGNVLNSGEQAYRFSVDKIMPIIGYFSRIERDCINNFESNLRLNKVNKFVNKLKEEKLLSEELEKKIEELVSFVTESNSSFSDLFVFRQEDTKDSHIEVNKGKEFEKAYYECMQMN